MKRIFLDCVVSLLSLGALTVFFGFFIDTYETINIGDIFLLPLAMVAFAIVAFVQTGYKKGFFTASTARLFGFFGVIGLVAAVAGSLLFMSALDSSIVVRSCERTFIWLVALCVPITLGVVLGALWGRRIATTA